MNANKREWLLSRGTGFRMSLSNQTDRCHDELVAEVLRLGARICDATGVSDFSSARQNRRRLHFLLRKGLRDRPDLSPGLLRLKAAWCSRRGDGLRLLHKSYRIAKSRRNTYQQAFSAVALADEHARRTRGAKQAKRWLLVAEILAKAITDPDIHKEIDRVQSMLVEGSLG